MLRRLALLALVFAAAAAPAASAKEGAQAHLLTPVPIHARAGSLITVRWTVDVVAAHGARIPLRPLRLPREPGLVPAEVSRGPR